jgi:hypothetical protein
MTRENLFDAENVVCDGEREFDIKRRRWVVDRTYSKALGSLVDWKYLWASVSNIFPPSEAWFVKIISSIHLVRPRQAQRLSERKASPK